MITKSFLISTQKVLDEAQGICEAIVNSTGIVDLQGDVMVPGCFEGVIKAAQDGSGKFPVICRDHDWGQKVGKVVEMEEYRPGDARLDAKAVPAGAGALRVKIQYNLGKQAGRDAFSDVDFLKDQLEWSIGFIPEAASVKWEKGDRYIGNVERLAEVSDVLIGASPGTFTATTKGALEGVLEERRAARLKDARQVAADFRETIKAAAEKAADLPDLTGDEAVHAGPLQQALDAINTLIAQELAEPGDVAEYGDVISLCFVAQDLLSWARGESSEYADMASSGFSIWDLMAAGHAALSKQKEAAAQQEAEKVAVAAAKAWAQGLFKEVLTETKDSSTHHNAPVHVGSDGLTRFARQRARPRFGG